jgi:hypothetical protein
MIKKLTTLAILIALAAGAMKLAYAKPEFMDGFNTAYPNSPLKGNCIVSTQARPESIPTGRLSKTVMRASTELSHWIPMVTGSPIWRRSMPEPSPAIPRVIPQPLL